MCLANKYKILTEAPKINISTIHQVKGGECENVVLLTDVSKSVVDYLDTDEEHRVWYVAVTRAKKRLYIVREQSNRYYKI